MELRISRARAPTAKLAFWIAAGLVAVGIVVALVVVRPQGAVATVPEGEPESAPA